MAFGTFNQGSAARFWVGTVDPPTTLVGGLKSVTYTGSRSTNQDDFLNGQASDVSIGKKVRRYQCAGIISSADDGMAVVKTASEDDTGPIIYGALSLNGTKGESLPSRVSNLEIAVPDANRKGTFTFTLEQADDPSDLTGGGLVE